MAQKTEYQGKSIVYYKSCRGDMLSLLPERCQYILDVGCAEGVTGQVIKARHPAAQVVGIEINPVAAEQARQVLDRVIVGEVESIYTKLSDHSFDCILFGDVLEHLQDPWRALREYRRFLRDDGCIVISVPNVQFYSVILGLLRGRWAYQSRGILDRTHLRFFTYREVIKLLEQARLSPVQVRYNIRLMEHNKSGARYAELLARFLPCLRPFLVFQYVILAVPQTEAQIE